jgi:NO-binding membrane sensor protein with MHYT domain
MGAIAIWSMHFVGNRAIVLLDGDLQMQIAYSSGATALSFFVPIFVLLAAFLAIGTNDKVSKVRVVIGGTLAGLAICGMHYLGQAGIANYGCVYSIAHVAGSGVIAVIASITALSIFFVFRAAWTNSAWKRALCAVVLAGAVSGMHWLASVGTQYKFRGDVSLKQNISRDQTVIIVIALVCGPYQPTTPIAFLTF